MIDDKKLGLAVRVRRGKRTLREVEGEVGVSFATLGRIERGDGCDRDTFAKVCTWIGVPMDYFLADEKAAAA